MTDETIYFGKIKGENDKYALWHVVPGNQHFVLGISFDRLSAYIEGATSLHFHNVKLNNGIPSKVRGRSHEEIQVEPLDFVSLEELVADSGLRLADKIYIINITCGS